MGLWLWIVAVMALLGLILLMILSFVLAALNGGRYFNPFI